MRKFLWVVPALVLCFLSIADAIIIIDVGDHDLIADTPSQVISITVTGDEQVEGANLLLQMGDGGDFLGGVDGSAPEITDVNLTSGTIFDGNNVGHLFEQSPTVQFWTVGTVTSSGTEAADGMLAEVTIDTTGFSSGTFVLKAGDIQIGLFAENSDFGEISATTINNGSITVLIPEPHGLMVVAALLMALRRTARRSRFDAG